MKKLLLPSLLLLGLPALLPAADIKEGEMAGYLFGPAEKVPEEFNGGFSLYAAAWPLVATYPGHRFQTGLCGTWMHPQWSDAEKPKEKLYTDVEGGLGWWRDTHFPSTTPKFIMGGVGPNFSFIANGPGYGAGTWEKPRGQYGVAQLSPWLLFPLDGLNLKQGTSGELFGYGYLPLPLTDPKPTTAGKNVPTGNQSWTLFLNTANFKGPAAFFTPFFWSQATVEHPEWAGLLLDSHPVGPNKAIQMETQYVPAVLSSDAAGKDFARVAPTSFPVGADGTSTVLHRLTAYKKAALSDDVEKWFAGGAAADGAIRPEASVMHHFREGGGSNWSIYPPGTKREEKVPLAWASFATSFTPNPVTFAYKWDPQLTRSSGSLITLPEFYLLGSNGKKPLWTVLSSKEVPAETGLAQYRFETAKEKPQEPRTTPEDAASCWKTPGPQAGPFQAHLGDGSVVTYYWYRFADQPALLNADLTAAEREQLQQRVEKLHRSWTKDRNYLTPPDAGALASIDPALVLTPPKGLEVGYVPIATRQELERPPVASTAPSAAVADPAPAKKFAKWDNNPNGVQVFILAGQSNMVGHGKAEDGHDNVKGGIGSLRYQVEHDPEHYGKLVNPDGTWKTRDDVQVWWRDSDLLAPRAVIKGNLKIGFAQSRSATWFGPEYGFGWTIAGRLQQPVLLIKVAWGGKSLHVDFRPPSAVAARGGAVGPYYTGLLDYAHDALDHLDTEFPEWKGKGYRIAGIGWHQGWNDRVDQTASANYEANLVDLINDLRAEFGNPKLPFSITTTSMAPPPERTAVERAQLAVADPQKYPAFQSNVRTTDARPFWRDASVSPSNFGYHWNHNGESEYLNGKALAEQMAEMLGR